MRWVIATPSVPPTVAGPAQYAAGIAGEIARRGNGVRIVAYGALERSLPPGFRHMLYALRALPLLVRADIILALDTWSVGLPALLVARLFRRKFMVRIGGDYLWESYIERTGEEVLLSEFYSSPRPLSRKERFVRSAIRYLLAHADALLFTTQWQRGIWQAGYGFESARSHVIENVFPAGEPPRSPLTQVFVAAGRPIRLKNMRRLERVFARVKERHPEIALDARPLPMAAHLKRVAECYAVIVPSYSEVNPNTLADAVRFGKPFIATRDTGAMERLRGVGIFLDTRDDGVLENAVERMLDGAAYEAAVARVRSFSYVRGWREVVDDIEAVARRI